MDAEILSSLIKELMPDCDSLSIPGIGTFRAEAVPASFSDRGFTVNPPYRRLYFEQTETADGRLERLFADSCEGVEPGKAGRILKAGLEELAATLAAGDSVELPGLGRLRPIPGGRILFVPDADLDISPESCGLPPVSLKTHPAAFPWGDDALPVQPTPAPQSPVSETVPDAPASEAAPATETGTTTAADIPAAPVEEPAPEPPAPQKRRPRRGVRAAVWTASSLAILLALFVLVSRLKPGSTDRLLYTQEQLEILYYQEDGANLSK